MRQHFPSGEGFTYLMTAIGEPSVPGAASFGDFRPLEGSFTTAGPHGVDVPDFLPGPGHYDNPSQFTATLTIPLPDGNVAGFRDRWALFTQDTIPAYQNLLQNDPERLRDLVGSDIGARIEDYRIVRRIDGLLAHYATDWHVRIEQ